MTYVADPLDVITEDEAKEALGIAGAAFDDRLATTVTAVSRRLDRLVGPIVRRTVTGEPHTGGLPWLELRLRPAVRAGLAVTIDGTAEPDVFAEPHHTDPALTSGYLWRDTRTPWPASSAIAVTYTAGRAATTTDVDRVFRRAALLMVRNLWRDTDPDVATVVGEYATPHRSFPTFAVPKAVRELLAGEITEVDL